MLYFIVMIDRLRSLVTFTRKEKEPKRNYVVQMAEKVRDTAISDGFHHISKDDKNPFEIYTVITTNGDDRFRAYIYQSLQGNKADFETKVVRFGQNENDDILIWGVSERLWGESSAFHPWHREGRKLKLLSRKKWQPIIQSFLDSAVDLAQTQDEFHAVVAENLEHIDSGEVSVQFKSVRLAG